MRPGDESPEGYREETVIESSIVEVPRFPEPVSPRSARPRRGLGLAVLAALALAALLVGAALLARGWEGNRAAELDYMRRVSAVNESGTPPAEVLATQIAEGEALQVELGGGSQALSAFIGALRSIEQTQLQLLGVRRDRVARLALLSQHRTLAERQAWLAQEPAPSAAHRALCALEAWRRLPDYDPSARFALLDSLESEAELTPLSLLTAAALQLEGEAGVIERSKALHALDRLGSAQRHAQDDPDFVAGRQIAGAWRAALLSDPLLGLQQLEGFGSPPPDDPLLAAWGQRLLGRLRWQTGDLLGARSALEAALQLDPVSGEAIGWQAFLAACAPPTREASALISAAGLELPRSDALAAARALLVAEDDPPRGEAFARAALARDRESALLQGVCAQALATRGERSSALEALEEAQDQLPALWAARLASELRLELSQWAEAKRELARGFKLAPRDPELLALAGWAALGGGEPEEAERIARELAASGADSPLISLLQARIHAYHGRWRQVVEQLHGAPVRAAMQPSGHLLAAEALIELGQARSAVRLLAGRSPREEPTRSYLEGRGYEILGEPQEARAAYARFLEHAAAQDPRRAAAERFLER